MCRGPNHLALPEEFLLYKDLCETWIWNKTGCIPGLDKIFLLCTKNVGEYLHTYLSQNPQCTKLTTYNLEKKVTHSTRRELTSCCVQTLVSKGQVHPKLICYLLSMECKISYQIQNFQAALFHIMKVNVGHSCQATTNEKKIKIENSRNLEDYFYDAILSALVIYCHCIEKSILLNLFFSVTHHMAVFTLGWAVPLHMGVNFI